MTAAVRLHPDRLAALPPAVARPRYDRSALAPGIVHLGVGAFMRAHLAVATEAALQADDDRRWGIVGVSLRHPDTRDAIGPQHGLYTLALRDRQARTLQVIGCLLRVLVAPEDPAAVLAAIADPATRIVSLTVTEKGYCRDPASGALRFDDPDIAHDLAHPEAPRSAIGFIVHGLARRRASGLGPVTLLSLDNLAANGDALARLVGAFAQRIDPALADWIITRCTAPNSMVDRIVPRTTDADRQAVAADLGCDDAWPVLAEPFFDWAVEDRFAAGRPAWERAGARVVAESQPWETLKLRMVNGSHSAIAYFGALAGWQTVDVAVGQPALRAHVEALMRDEIEPTLPHLPGLDLDLYRASLLTRFDNPALAHRTQQIAMDGSQKLPQRWLATLRERLASDQPIDRLGLSIAGWLHYLRGRDEAGHAYPIDDPLASLLAERVRAADAQADATARAATLIDVVPVFGDLARSQRLIDVVSPALESLRSRGVAETLHA